MACELRTWLEARTTHFVWVDAGDYARRVFAGDAPAWFGDPALHASALAQAHELLPSRCVVVDVTAAALAELPDGPREAGQVTAALEGAANAGFAEAVLDALVHRYGEGKDLWLSMASPQDLLAGGAPDGEAGFDAQDDVATALGARLRALAARPVAGLVLRSAAGAAFDADACDACEPLVGLARHYGWLTALAFDAVTDGAADPGGLDVDLVLLGASPCDTLDPAASPCVGGGLDPDFWRGAALPPGSGRLLYGAISADAQPESVLAAARALGA